MKRFALVIGTLILGFSGLTSEGAEPSPFHNFAGQFSKNGHVTVRRSGEEPASGKISQSFHIGATGRSARLKIVGNLRLNGAVRPFSVIYVFRKANREGVQGAAISNLAPGVDDGFSADEGSYVLTSGQITANVPFVFGTTSGHATLRIRLKKRSRGIQLAVVQTLSISTQTSPITWRFEGLSRR